jgi:hypothetical protein
MFVLSTAVGSAAVWLPVGLPAERWPELSKSTML